MLNIKNILLVFLLAILLIGCGEDRAASTTKAGGVLGVVEIDNDGDGISNNDEVNIYGTNPDSNDTDGDGLLDWEEINTYDSNATNDDTDGDGLLDGEEVHTYDTNLTNSDTDGDCLLDGFEILNYETNASNSDTDGDFVSDGLEIYSYGLDFNTSCLSAPETLVKGVNHNPAIDNLPSDGTDVINALDPSNHKDTDSDGLTDRYENYLGTDPLLADTDGDGLKDGEEIYTYETNATNADTDGDGLKDGEEINIYDSNATNNDTDGDGLLDGDEVNVYDTNLTNFDTDGDGLSDGEEVNIYDSNATNSDTDGDGLLDGDEVNVYDTNLTNSDTDGDGLSDGEEVNTYESNATSSDTDGDGLLDGDELNTYNTSLDNNDTDGDGLLDGLEVSIYGTSPDNNDTDSDGLLDGEEINTYDSNATNSDTDGDGLLDGDEVNIYDTNLTNSDTDGDCLLDGFEILNYETNASNSDTDGDSVSDGVEIYSYGLEFNSTCLTNPESLVMGVNANPAIDNIPNDGSDVINALDPTNHQDTDGDGLSDRYEDYIGTNPLLADTDGDGLTDGEEINTYDTNATNADTDGDGLKDGEEINVYDTNVTNPDTDSDGLTDGEEIHTYGTNVLNEDTDGDTLLDGDEINTYETNATNADTDGDCLLDPHEVLHYETNASNEDTDNDGVVDGIEIYTYTINEYNRTCLSSSETLAGGYNESPAIDNNPDDGSDVINALDPNNDIDGDGQSNIEETQCPQGDVFNPLRICPSIEHATAGRRLEKFGYSYVPGAFDVDGDGVNEGGFWISRYQARASVNDIGSEIVIEKVGNVNQYLSDKFKVLNRNVQVLSYDEETLNETSTTAGSELIFEIEEVASRNRIDSFTPYLAEVCLSEYTLKDDSGIEIDINITMPTLKQYIHVKMLLDADLVNGGDGRHVRNGLLGNDLNVPLNEYSIVVDEFGENRKEFVRNLIQLENTFGTDTFSYANDVPSWWLVDISKSGDDKIGSSSTQNLGYGIGPDKDPYAVIVRDGAGMNIGFGVSGALTDDTGTTNGISFRAATDYLY